MRKRKFLLIAALMLCSTVVLAGTLQIRKGYVREMPPGQSTSAAYMDLINSSDRPIAIVAAVCDAAQIVEVHAYRRANGATRMQLIRRLVIPAHGQVQLAPGGYHLMLINLKRSLHAGEDVGVTLLDEEGRSYSARFPVVKMLGTAQ